jgi:hypothetical protein
MFAPIEELRTLFLITWAKPYGIARYDLYDPEAYGLA